MCLIVAKRDDVTTGDIEASLPGTKNPKLETQKPLELYRAL